VLSARENLEFFCDLHGVSRRRAGELLEEVGLGAVAGRRAAELSRGMLQRLALARAVIHAPDLLVLDEPDAGLDEQGRGLLASFGFDVGQAGPGVIAPGVLWLALVFAGLVAFGRTFAAERDQGSLESLLLTPASRAAIFLGKALAAAILLLACEVVLVPGLALFFGTPIASPTLVGALALATVGMAALGCLFAALAAQTRARELLLPVLALPLWIPFVV